jgi:TPR repeat protein
VAHLLADRLVVPSVGYLEASSAPRITLPGLDQAQDQSTRKERAAKKPREVLLHTPNTRQGRNRQVGQVLGRLRLAHLGGKTGETTMSVDGRRKAVRAGAAKSPSVSGLFAAAKKLYNAGLGGEDYRRAFQILKRAATLGHPGAHEWLGAVYDYGLGVRPNRRLAFQHYKIAADSGRPNAEYHVGIFYHEGISVPKDYRLAVEWLRKAAKHGDATAIYWLGQCYLHGRGVRKDDRKGFELELAAARKQVPDAQYSAGVCFERGQGVPVNLRRAMTWYLRAAKNGCSSAAYSLSRLYETGQGMIPINKHKARFWSKKGDAMNCLQSSNQGTRPA